jgi:hypothetical protein
MNNSFNNAPISTRNPALERKQANHKRALGFLALTAFLLMADPLMNIYIGPVPIYIIDFLIFLTWISASQVSSSRRYPLRGFVVFIMLAMLASELIAGLQLGTLVQPVYLIARTLLAISLFFSVPKIVQSKDDLFTLMKAALPGALISAMLMVASSLPPTQGIAARIFSIHLLMPSAEDVAAAYGFASIAMRGESLIGVSILSAAFLNTIWPMLFLLRADDRLGARWRLLLLFAIVLMPLGVIFSYSRGAIAGLAMIVVSVFLLGSSKIRGPIIIGVAAVVLILSWVGFGSQYFLFDWLQTKAQYQLANPTTSEDVTARTGAYIDPFLNITENPSFILFGEGFARLKIDGATSVAGNSHAVFGAAAFGYGMLAAFAYVGLLLDAFLITWRHAWGAKDEFLRIFARALLAGLFSFASWFILGPAAVSEPRGAELLFLVFGLVAAQSNFVSLSEPAKSVQSPALLRTSVLR